jgi:signal transduction histidine kinase
MKHSSVKHPLGTKQRSPWAFLLKIALSVFCAETFIMLLFLWLPKLPDLVETFLDSTLLSVLIAPVLYFFMYRPLVQEISVRSRIEAELRQSQGLLEQQTRELEETLRKLQQAPQLIQSEKMSSLGRLVAGIAHEINNPVNFVYGNLSYVQEYVQSLLEMIQLYERYYPQPEPEIQAKAVALDVQFLQQDLIKILNSMKAGCDRIRQIVLSLRNFSRMDEAEFKAVNIHEGIDNTLIILQHRLKAKSDHSAIQVIKDYGNLPLVECFPGKLNQVFMNLLSNAIDALEEAMAMDQHNWVSEGSQMMHDPSEAIPTITIQTDVVDAKWVQIAIADNGMGIPDNVRQRIFEPFFTTKPVGKGTGLGLSISYHIVVKKHAGMLECHSTPGQGTQFVIQLPIQGNPLAKDTISQDVF